MESSLIDCISHTRAVAAFCASLLFAASSMADSLALWRFTSNSQASPSLPPADMHSSLSSASLSLGHGVAPGSKSNSFGGTGFNGADSLADALLSGKYLEISLVAGDCASITPTNIACSISRSTTGPTLFKWVHMPGGGTASDISAEFRFTGSSTNISIPVSAPTAPGEGAKILLVACGASSGAGSLYFHSSLEVLGTVESTVAQSLSLGEIPEMEIAAGKTLSFSIPVSGHGGKDVAYDLAASPTPAGSFAAENGRVVFSPEPGDEGEYVFSLVATSAEESARVSFAVTVLPYVRFTEGFEDGYKGAYSPGGFETSLAAWFCSNGVVKAPAQGDFAIGSRMMKLKGPKACAYMLTDKPLGLSSLSLHWGINGEPSRCNAEIYLSRDGGGSWSKLEAGDAPLADSFAKFCATGLEIRGGIRVKIEFSAGSENDFLCIDDIALADYGAGEDALPARPGITLKENFDSIRRVREAALPHPWRVAGTNSLSGFPLSYEGASAATTQFGGADSITKTAGIYNLGDGAKETAPDRAVGFMSSSENFRTCGLMVPIENTGDSEIDGFTVSYSVEKYRTGTAKSIVLCISGDGMNWTTAPNAAVFTSAADASTPQWMAGAQRLARIKTRVRYRLPPRQTFFLGWFYRSSSAQEAANAQVLGIDDISIRCSGRFVFAIH